MGTMLKNYWTTITGVLLAIANYLATIGPDQFPQTKQQWLSFLMSLLLAALGIGAKDALTGSKPK